MLLDTHDPDIRYVKISPEERRDYLERLKKIIGEEFDDLHARLSKRLNAVRASKTITLTSLFSERCSFSLLALLSEIETPFASLTLGSFFCKYFVMAFDEAGENSRRELLGRLRSGVNQQGHLSHFFFELAVANTFRRRGHQVTLAVEDGQPDLRIETKATVASIECKCITVDAGQSIPKRIFDAAADLARDFALDALGTKIRHYLRITFKAKSSAAYSDSTASLKRHLLNLSSGEIFSSDRYWEVLREPMSQSAQAAAEKDDQIALMEQATQQYPTFSGACLLVPGSDFVLLSGTAEVKLHRAVNDAISKACRQLPTEGVRAVFVQLSGVSAQLPNGAFSAMTEIIKNITRNQDLRQRHILQSVRRNGYVGIVFCSDFYEIQDGTDFGVDYSTSIYRTLYDPDYWLYEFDLLRWTPSQYDDRLKKGGVVDIS